MTKKSKLSNLGYIITNIIKCYMLTKKDKSDEKFLMNKKNLKSSNDMDFSNLDVSGVYCIRLNILNINGFPKKFIDILNCRGHNIVYIGIATKSLKQRLNQELRAKGHGAFFRSLGAILGYEPRKDSLDKQKRQYNYKFLDEDEEKIIRWINEHLSVKLIEKSDNLVNFEKYLIKYYGPLVNIRNNPLVLNEIKELRKNCVDIANKN